MTAFVEVHCSVIFLSRVAFCVFPVRPESPLITLNQTAAPLKEGDYLALTCSTQSGNPPPGIRWLRNNDVITDSDSVMTLPDDKFGVTSSTIVRRLEHADHHANYTCTAENEANIGLPVMNSVLLQVQCEYSICHIFFGPRGQMRSVQNESHCRHRPCCLSFMDIPQPDSSMNGYAAPLLKHHALVSRPLWEKL